MAGYGVEYLRKNRGLRFPFDLLLLGLIYIISLALFFPWISGCSQCACPEMYQSEKYTRDGTTEAKKAGRYHEVRCLRCYRRAIEARNDYLRDGTTDVTEQRWCPVCESTITTHKRGNQVYFQCPVCAPDEVECRRVYMVGVKD